MNRLLKAISVVCCLCIITFLSPATTAKAMDSDGSFTFGFYSSLTSDTFKATSSTISIKISDCNLYEYSGSTNSVLNSASSVAKAYTLTLYDKSNNNKSVGTLSESAGNGYTWTIGVTKGHTYYFQFNHNYPQYWFSGSGKVTY